MSESQGNGAYLPECPDCLRYWIDTPHLVGALASVGIEHGKSTYQMAVEYMASYHRRGHADA